MALVVSDERAARLRERIKALQDRKRQPVDLAPSSAYEALTRQKLDVLVADVAELRGRVNTLLWALGGAVALNVVLRLAGL